MEGRTALTFEESHACGSSHRLPTRLAADARRAPTQRAKFSVNRDARVAVGSTGPDVPPGKYHLKSQRIPQKIATHGGVGKPGDEHRRTLRASQGFFLITR
jgi:hypothetical protein